MLTENNPCKSAFEEALLNALLSGEHLLLSTLRSQYAVAACQSRELSGVGFFLNFSIPDGELLTQPSDFVLGDVCFELPGLQLGGGALLFVRSGKLLMLEGYCYEDSWPETTEGFSIRYTNGPVRDLTSLISVRNTSIP